MVYQPKAKAPEPVPVEEVKAVEPVSLPLGQDGPLFKSLPGLKVLDPKLMNQPNFQKFINVQSEDVKKSDV